MKRELKAIILVFFISLTFSVFKLYAQSFQVSIHHSVQLQFERQIEDSLMPVFTSVKPFQSHWHQKWQQPFQKDISRGRERQINGHFLRYADSQFYVWANPILNIGFGRVSNPRENTTQNTRGVQMGMSIGKQISLGMNFAENQASFPGFVDNFIIRNRGVAPGQGITRSFEGTGYDFAYTDAFVRWHPGKVFSATLGYGQNFLGEGYRSLFLSDNAFNYPYLQINVNFNRFHYTAMINQYENLFYKLSDRYQRKWSSIHYLTVKLGKRWHVGVFESVVWQAEDSVSKRGFDFAYLNPVPFMRPIEFANGSADNMLMGLHAKYKAAKNTYLYTQILLDDFNFQATRDSSKQHLNNKYAIQLGVKNFSQYRNIDIFSRIEYNYSRPYMYGHRKPAQSYTHYQQPLAHPLGANFHELILQLNLTYKRWYFESHNQLAWVGRQNPAVNFNQGNNLFGGEDRVPTYGSFTLQGIRTKQQFNQVTFGYVTNPKWNVGLEVSYTYRKTSADNNPTNLTNWFRFGVVTRLRNSYLDF